MATRATAAGRRSAAADIAPAFAALGDEARLRMVAQLVNGPQSIARLTDGTAISRQAITKHLLVLERAGLAQSGRVGRERLWRVQPRRLGEVRLYLDQISAQWDEAIGRLKAFVESDPG